MYQSQNIDTEKTHSLKERLTKDSIGTIRLDAIESIESEIKRTLFPDWNEENAAECFMIRIDCPHVGSDVIENIMSVPYDESIANKALNMLEKNDTRSNRETYYYVRASTI